MTPGRALDSATIGNALETAIASADFAALAELYGAGATLDASIPGERVRVRGAESILDCFASWWPAPGRLLEWALSSHPLGCAIWLERAGEDGSLVRQRHYVHVDGGKVSRHWIYAAPPRAAQAGPGGETLSDKVFGGLGEVVEASVVASTGWSGSRLERLTLADGTALVAKRIVPGSDWLARATADPGREALLFSDGVMDRFPEELDHTIVAAERDGEAWWIAMRDAAPELLDAASPMPREQHRRVLHAMNGVWETFWDERVPHLVPQLRRLEVAGPKYSEIERNGLDLLPKQFEPTWEAFADAVEPDVAEPVLKLVADPAPLAEELAARGTTLLHGDVRDEQLGFGDGRVVLIDWGLATQGHPVIEYAWYMVHCAWRIEATHDELIEDFRRVRGDRDDPRALELGMIAGLVMYGWIFGHCVIVHPDPDERDWARFELDWWVPRVRRALETFSP